MTSPINQIQGPFDTTTTFAPTSPMVSIPDRSTKISVRLVARQLQQWQEELKYIQKEIDQILLIQKLYLNHEIHSVTIAAEALQDILNHQLSPLLELLNQLQSRLSSKGALRANFDYKNQYADLHEQVKDVRIKICPLKSCILEAMLESLPLAIM